MAIDAQGAEKARPFVEAAGVTFSTVVDRNNLLSGLFGFKAVPNALFIDEDGVIAYQKYTGFDIQKPEFRQAAETWADGQLPTEASQGAEVTNSENDHAKAVRLFDNGMKLYESGQTRQALALWRDAGALEPDNYVIRKQIWAVENPDKFYAGDVDYDWQKTQLAQNL